MSLQETISSYLQKINDLRETLNQLEQDLIEAPYEPQSVRTFISDLEQKLMGFENPVKELSEQISRDSISHRNTAAISGLVSISLLLKKEQGSIPRKQEWSLLSNHHGFNLAQVELNLFQGRIPIIFFLELKAWELNLRVDSNVSFFWNPELQRVIRISDENSQSTNLLSIFLKRTGIPNPVSIISNFFGGGSAVVKIDVVVSTPNSQKLVFRGYQGRLREARISDRGKMGTVLAYSGQSLESLASAFQISYSIGPSDLRIKDLEIPRFKDFHDFPEVHPKISAIMDILLHKDLVKPIFSSEREISVQVPVDISELV
jgi:hypothetical protein